MVSATEAIRKEWIWVRRESWENNSYGLTRSRARVSRGTEGIAKCKKEPYFLQEE